jgi:uncharacterized phiE125 gp8 family phage protein
MASSITITRPAAPLDLIVTVEEVKTNAGGIEDASEDALIGLMIRSAQSYVEAAADTVLNPSTVVERFGGFSCGAIKLGREPVRSVTSVLYMAVDGTETALAADKRQEWLTHNPPLIAPLPDAYWPEVKTGAMGPVKVTYEAGPALAVNARDEFKLAVVMIATATFEHRDAFLKNGELKVPDLVRQLVQAGARRGYP